MAGRNLLLLFSLRKEGERDEEEREQLERRRRRKDERRRQETTWTDSYTRRQPRPSAALLPSFLTLFPPVRCCTPQLPLYTDPRLYESTGHACLPGHGEKDTGKHKDFYQQRSDTKGRRDAERLGKREKKRLSGEKQKLVDACPRAATKTQKFSRYTRACIQTKKERCRQIDRAR